MSETKNSKKRRSERGNVLFLILIAVALFAALSYAVTQSTRSGGGSGDNETALISSAQLTQYPASVRTAVVRMIIGGTNVADLEFNPPSGADGFTDCSSGFASCVFHPSGGGATYSNAPRDMMASTGGNVSGVWTFNAENQVELLGTSSGNATPSTATADLVAFLPGISQTLCNRINQELGLPSTAPVEDAAVDTTTQMVNTDGSSPVGVGATGGTIGLGAAAGLDGQPFGCFEDSAGAYVYYHVLVER